MLQGATKLDAAVQAKQQQLIDEKTQHIPSSPKLNKRSNDDSLGNNVKIVDKKYLE
jgi:hypothetical protein